MSGYSWPNYPQIAARARTAWDCTVAELPVGSPVAGEVIGRQPFGVFIRLDGHPDAVGLAEVTAMPQCGTLPLVGEQVSGEVIWHAEHNHQVKIRLTDWTRSERWTPQRCRCTAGHPRVRGEQLHSSVKRAV